MSEITYPKYADSEIDEVLVSAGQQDLWLAEQLTEKQLYIVPVTYELTGLLDQDKLLNAIAQVVQSSEAFRTAFIEGDQGLVQHIYPEIELPVTVVDLSGQDTAQNDHERLQLALMHCQRNLETPFTLSQPGLARFFPDQIRRAEPYSAFLPSPPDL
ncbi:condensation domain-containing protein [Xenorhabdus nematophila]|uniref:condensation domain-containing protein n=1 Tax=Xenorhabdus nematophila TaxID=628 RepID=UPI000A5AFCF8|nr:condensation domain-containing protein [Xenorhabdus nematophila]